MLKVLSDNAINRREYQSGTINLKWGPFNCWTELTQNPNSIVHNISMPLRNFRW